MRALLPYCLHFPALLLAAAASGAAAADPAGPLQSMAFLAGHCWKGSFPGQDQTDEHCFEWLYDGRFLRDRHVVHGQGHADYLGETTYWWDPQQQQIRYLYIENQGGFSQGAVSVAADGLLFPPTTYVEGGKEQVYRSRWKRSGDDAYEALNEFKAAEGWALAWKVMMRRQPEDAPK